MWLCYFHPHVLKMSPVVQWTVLKPHVTRHFAIRELNTGIVIELSGTISKCMINSVAAGRKVLSGKSVWKASHAASPLCAHKRSYTMLVKAAMHYICHFALIKVQVQFFRVFLFSPEQYYCTDTCLYALLASRALEKAVCTGYLYVLPVFVWVSSGFSGFLPHAIRWIGYSVCD